MAGPWDRPLDAIAVGSHGRAHQELFVLVEGEVWHRWWMPEPQWSDWHKLTRLGMTATDIAVSSLTEGHLEVYALDATGRMRHRWYWPEPGWSDWTDMTTPRDDTTPPHMPLPEQSSA